MSETTLAVRDWNGATIPQAGTYTLDTAHSRVGFVVKHLMVSKVRGNFGDFEGTITISEDPLQSSVSATIQTSSVHTGQETRDNHLRSADFFETEKYPVMTFRTTGVAAGGGDSFTVSGELTIRDVTRPVELALDLEGVAVSPYGQQVFGFTATTEINREDFGLTYNQALETGGVMVGKQIKIEIEGEAVRS
ncbi:MAG: YceI family protein [Actinocatenispora sp.]